MAGYSLGHLVSETLSSSLSHQEIKEALPMLSQSRGISIKQLQSFLGLANFASIVDPVLKTFSKTWASQLRQMVRRRKSLGLHTYAPSGIKHSKNLAMSKRAWTRKSCFRRTVSFLIPQSSMDLFTDASNAGWGYHTSEGYEAEGLWPEKFLHPHINVKEMIVLYLALKDLFLPPHLCLKVYCDN